MPGAPDLGLLAQTLGSDDAFDAAGVELRPSGGDVHTAAGARSEFLVYVARPDPLPGALGLVQEAHLLERLGDAGVPAPAPVGSQPVMLGEVEGLVVSPPPGLLLADRLPPRYPRTPSTRQDISIALVDTLVRIHDAVEPPADLPVRSNAELVETLQQLLDAVEGRSLEGLGEHLEQLRTTAPEAERRALLHGDFRLGNLRYDPEDPSHVTGVMGWDLACVGDPLTDLGYLLACWPEQPDEPAVLAHGGALTCDDGFFSRATVTHEYAARCGSDLRALRWYTSYGYARLAVLSECERILSNRSIPVRHDDDPVRELARLSAASL